ncbi:MAG: hypothetical protein R3D55_07940 [Chloroflexota bacterium]
MAVYRTKPRMIPVLVNRHQIHSADETAAQIPQINHRPLTRFRQTQAHLQVKHQAVGRAGPIAISPMPVQAAAPYRLSA